MYEITLKSKMIDEGVRCKQNSVLLINQRILLEKVEETY